MKENVIKTEMEERILTNLEHELEDALNQVIQTYEIPLFLDESQKNAEMAYSVFVSANSPTPKKKSKKSKNMQANVAIGYSPNLTFDVDYLNSVGLAPYKLSLIYMYTKAECTQAIYNRISYWSKALFKKVSKVFECYGLDLNMLPYEIYGDIDNNLYISKLPTFSDLKFFDNNDSTKVLDKNEFIRKQAEGLIDTASHFTDLKCV